MSVVSEPYTAVPTYIQGGNSIQQQSIAVKTSGYPQQALQSPQPELKTDDLAVSGQASTRRPYQQTAQQQIVNPHYQDGQLPYLADHYAPIQKQHVVRQQQPRPAAQPVNNETINQVNNRIQQVINSINSSQLYNKSTHSQSPQQKLNTTLNMRIQQVQQQQQPQQRIQPQNNIIQSMDQNQGVNNQPIPQVQPQKQQPQKAKRAACSGKPENPKLAQSQTGQQSPLNASQVQQMPVQTQSCAQQPVYVQTYQQQPAVQPNQSNIINYTARPQPGFK